MTVSAVASNRSLRAALALAMVVGFASVSVTISRPAGADIAPTVPPVLSVSPTAGPVGSIVTVQFGPAGNGCGPVRFTNEAGTAGPLLPLQDHGTERFLVPHAIVGASAPVSTVAPGPYLFTLACDTSNNPATLRTVSVPFTVTSPLPPQFVGIASTPDGKGYWLAQSNGGVYSYGDAAFYGSLPGSGIVPAAQITGLAATPDGKGYWLVGADGGVFAFGDAAFYGSLAPPPEAPSGNSPSPAIGIVTTPDGRGYLVVFSDGVGQSAAFGDAKALGSPTLFDPIVGLASTATGDGYRLAAADGGVFSYGDAGFLGSMGGVALNQPVVGMSTDPATGGYWEVAADGGVFAFGAPFLGSTGNIWLNRPIVGMGRTPSGLGYWFLAADGGVFAFGDAQFYGSAA